MPITVSVFNADSLSQHKDDVQMPRRVGVMYCSHLLESTSGHVQRGRGAREAPRRRGQGAPSPMSSDRRRRATAADRRKSLDFRRR